MAVRGLSTIRDREPRTSTSTFTQLLSSESRFVDATLNCQGRSELWSCVKVKVALLGSPSVIVFMVSVDIKQRCVKVEVAVLGSPSLAVLRSLWT